MKAKKYYLSLGIVFAILCVPALSQIEYYPAAEESLRIVPHPGLVGVKLISVTIVAPDEVFGKEWSEQEKLKAEVESKLKNAGLNVFIPKEGIRYRLGEISEVKVQMEMFRFTNSKEYICRAQTLLSRTVNLAHKYKQSRTFRAYVWKSKPAVQVVSIEDMPAAVSGVILEQVETFIHTCLAANPPGKQTSDGRTSKTDSLTAAEKQTKPVAKSAVVEYKYVASKNSKVFHKPGCSWAKRIKPENLVGYNSRDEAIKAGKRPCKMCNP